MGQDQKNLPAQIADALMSIPPALMPSAVKALDQLIGASVEIPVAWLNQKKAKIDAQTESYKLVEASIAKAVAMQAEGDEEIAQRALTTLVRKEYRKLENKTAVAAAMVEDMRNEESVLSKQQENGEQEQPKNVRPVQELSEDWLNVFERYAEDASSERLQDLWGRVLAGEIRQPGRYSPRTLRFLSEFSQADALLFEEFSKKAFGNFAPKSALMEGRGENISHLIQMEASGLIQGGSGLGLNKPVQFDDQGNAVLAEHDLFLVLQGEPKTKFQIDVVVLTPLAQELLSLVGSRDKKEAARTVGRAIRRPAIKCAFLGLLLTNTTGTRLQTMEILWQDQNREGENIEGTAS